MKRRARPRIPARLHREALRLFAARPHLGSRIKSALPLALEPSRIEPVYQTTIDHCRCADTFFRRPFWIPYRLPCKHRIALWLRKAARLEEE